MMVVERQAAWSVLGRADATILALCDSRTGKRNVLNIPVRRDGSEWRCCGLEVSDIRRRPGKPT